MAMPLAVLSCRSFSQGLSWVFSAKLLGATESSAPVSTKILQGRFGGLCCVPSPKLFLLHAVAASGLGVSKLVVCGAVVLHHLLRRSWLGSP